jgi:hypothetical protein
MSSAKPDYLRTGSQNEHEWNEDDVSNLPLRARNGFNVEDAVALNGNKAGGYRREE